MVALIENTSVNALLWVKSAETHKSRADLQQQPHCSILATCRRIDYSSAIDTQFGRVLAASNLTSSYPQTGYESFPYHTQPDATSRITLP